jgi:hypothetical protein
MTSQIIALNRTGVAVASDSIGTIYDSNGDYLATVTSKKVFDLGSMHKIVLLNSDNTWLSGAPVDVLIAAWTKTLNKELPKVWNYLENFLDWLENQADDLFPDMTNLFRDFIYDQLRPISERIAQAHNGLRPFSTETLTRMAMDKAFARTYKARVGREINAYLKELDELSHLSLIDDVYTPEEQMQRQQQACDEANVAGIIDLWFPDVSISPSTKTKLCKEIHKSLGKRPIEKFSSLCRLTFVGYGSEEVYPHLFELGLESKFKKIVRWRGLGSANVDTEQRSEIYLMAQTSAIRNFLDGVHPDFLQNLKAIVPTAVADASRVWDSDPDHQDEDTYELWRDMGNEVFTKLEKYMNEFRHQNKIGLTTRLDFMETSELAKIAKALVELEVLATLNTQGPSTVGGDVVLATVDLRNGVSWQTQV